MFFQQKHIFIFYRYFTSYGPDAKRHELRYLMNGAIRREENRGFSGTVAGQRTDRWLDQVADLMGSTVGISSNRDVSKYSACKIIFVFES